MRNRPHEQATADAVKTDLRRDALGDVASLVVISAAALATPSLVHAADGGLSGWRWLMLLVLAVPGLIATDALWHRRLAIHRAGHRSPLAWASTTLMVCASLCAWVFVTPFFLEMWLRA